ncbi:enoyl-CoA hydratase/isomerase family protein [Nocardioides dubius]|uniref:Enoyl-CoA hydratase-related protein n=1 Tax=Nocardioides dubius TaxID=317019 RepID=A0ABN1TX16_9ACTN
MPESEASIKRVPLIASGSRMLGADFDRIAAATAACADDGSRVLVLGSSTPGMFTTGADLDEARAALDDPAAYVRRVSAAVRAIAECPVPTIAAVGGPCVGIGFEICLNTDFTLASADAWFWFPEMGFGLPPVAAASTLAQLVGPRRAMALMVRAERIPAEQARAEGLIDDVVAGQQLAAAVTDLAALLAGRSADAVRDLRAAVRTGPSADALDEQATGWLVRALAGGA